MRTTNKKEAVAMCRSNTVDARRKIFDPDLLYIECAKCGRALNWDKGETSLFLVRSGINTGTLDWSFMILSMGCANCSPDELGYMTKLVQVSEKQKKHIRRV
jgi:hypothetical protein